MALASKIGKPTGETTKAGRPVYKTPEGEFVSEKSVTIPVNGKWVNASSIWNGRRIDEDGVMRLIKEGAIKPTSVHDTEEEAIAAAKKRSSGLMRKKYQAGGMSTDYEQQIMDMQGTAPEGSEDSFGKALTEISADLTPGIGEVRSAIEAKKAYKEGDMLGVGLGVVGAIPGIGTGIRGVKAAGRAIKASKLADLGKQPDLIAKKGQDAYDALNLNTTKVEQWRKENKVSQRQAPLPDMEEAAEKLSKKEITSDEFRQLSKDRQPITLLKEVPKMPTFEDIAGALKENQVRKAGIVGVNLDIPAGTKVASRLDIPAYNEYDTWIVSLHDGTKKAGNAVGYAKTAVLKDVSFESDSRVALDIARRKELKAGGRMGKATIARAFGDWVPHDPAKAKEYAESVFDDPDWVQVGMNPYRASYFYDKADGMPVVAADEIVQVGPLVLAKNVKKAEPNDPKFKVDPQDPDSPTFKEGGLMKPKKMQMGGIMLPQERKPTYSSTMTTPAGSRSDTNTGGVVAVPEEEARASTTTLPTKIMKMPPGMAKGGMLEEGGLLQEGGTVDPASGNEVPTGSLQEEVRDDIPAQLSEGEFVFPADVVRFIGLERLMKMRQAAKEGLQKMNDMGQMGNAEEATMDDGADTEFETEIDDILAEVKREGQQV